MKECPQPPTQETKLCRSCHRRLPIEQFHRYHRGGEKRRGQCWQCRNPNRKKQVRNREILGNYCWRLRHSEDSRRVQLLVKEMTHRLGGIHGVTELWVESLKKSKPNSVARVNLLVGMGYLFLRHEQHEQKLQKESLEAMNGMSDDELSVAKERLLKEILESVPSGD